jgi:hypothetical protein
LLPTAWADGRFDPRMAHAPQWVPYGLVGVISPWNFPVTLSMIDTIPALLAGCSVIIKPSEVTPRFVAPLQAAIAEVPALEGVLQLVLGDGGTGVALIDVVDAILENDISEKLSDEEMDLEEESGCMTDAVHHLMEHLKYRQEIERLYTDADEAVMRIGSLEAVLNAVAQYEQDATEPNLGDFLASVTLSGREYGSSKDKNAGMNAVSLMTYHSAKGLEFPIVYMVGMEEGVLPHRRSITEEGDSVDEERRLCYVGVTRAQDELALTLPLSRFKWGKPRPTYPSRFLYELTDQADNPNRAKAIKAAADEARKASRTAR